jgi:hypothetical protein
MVHVGREAACLSINQFGDEIEGMTDWIHLEEITGNFLWAIPSRIACDEIELAVVLSFQDE